MNILFGMMLLVIMANTATNGPVKPPVPEIERKINIDEICVECDDECTGCMEYCDCPFCLYDTVPTLTLHIYFKDHPAELVIYKPRHHQK